MRYRTSKRASGRGALLGGAVAVVALSLPVFAGSQAGPVVVTVTTSPNPYAIKGASSVANAEAILGLSSGAQGIGVAGVSANTGGAGVEGIASSTSGTISSGVFGYSANGPGVLAEAPNTSYPAVFAVDTAGTGTGVLGFASSTYLGGTGVAGVVAPQVYYPTPPPGSSPAPQSIGVLGTDRGSEFGNIGVQGVSMAGTGVAGESDGETGIFASLTNAGPGSQGVLAYASGANTAIVARTTGQGLSSLDAGRYGNSDVPKDEVRLSISGAAILAYGDEIDTIQAVERSVGVTPIDVFDASGAQTFMVQAARNDSPNAGRSGESGVSDVQISGDLYVSGNIYSDCPTFPETTGSDCPSVTGFDESESAPKATMGDAGEAQVVNGAGYVALDPSFVKRISFRQPYLVYLTPLGDTRGLFVASKTQRGFTVRETQGGHATLAFDYRILAVPLAPSRATYRGRYLKFDAGGTSEAQRRQFIRQMIAHRRSIVPPALPRAALLPKPLARL